MAQAHGLSLIDGEWVSRPLDPYQIMANAPQDDVEMRDATPKPTSQVPEYGILSQTVFETPLSKLILPAKIRHKDLTDVVMVGEDFIRVKEIRDYGQIRHVASKTDFNGGRIITAKVFGDSREVSATTSGSPSIHQNYMKHRARRPTTGNGDDALPPEVIVLTLSNRLLMFLWAQHDPAGTATFIQKTIKLPAGSSRLDRFGTFLAIDPKCRAMAVAAHEGRFILYKTKPMERWKRDSRMSNEIAAPIEDERIMSIEGQIMHMDFLSSGGGQDDYHVVLLFVVVLQGRTRLTCFDWDCRQDLSKATPRTERYLVQSGKCIDILSNMSVADLSRGHNTFSAHTTSPESGFPFSFRRPHLGLQKHSLWRSNANHSADRQDNTSINTTRRWQARPQVDRLG